MSLPLRTARIFWLKRTVKWTAVRPAPAPAGHSLLVSRFLHGDVNAIRTKTGWWLRPCNAAGGRSLNGYFLPSISMAKTRATPTLRQLHIPPNVTAKCKRQQ